MTWKWEKLEAQLEVVRAIKDYAVVSGGLAWHLMSPVHVENKRVHDHSDVDLFIIPEHFSAAIAILKSLDFHRWYTKYDRITPNFYRYGKTTTWTNGKRVKTELDLFVRQVPYREIGDFKVITVEALLPMYQECHSSSGCTAVIAAKWLVKRGIDPLGRKELVEGIPRRPS